MPFSNASLAEWGTYSLDNESEHEHETKNKQTATRKTADLHNNRSQVTSVKCLKDKKKKENVSKNQIRKKKARQSTESMASSNSKTSTATNHPEINNLYIIDDAKKMMAELQIQPLTTS